VAPQTYDSRPAIATVTLNRGRALQLRGHAVTAVVTAAEGEIERRTNEGLGAVTDAAILRTLATMPVGEPLAWSTLSRNQQKTLRRAPAGTVERAGRRVTRRLIPPLRVEAITVAYRQADRALTAASQFAPFCRRAVVLPEAAVTDVILLEAAYFGIGVYVTTSDTCRVIQEPAPFVVSRWTWAQWQFHEQAWAQLLTAPSLNAVRFPVAD
jgi:hypothetical protein